MTALPPGPLLPGAVSIVIGGSTGIGLAAAWALARHGSAVELAANDPAGVSSAVSELRAEGYDVNGTVLDVARPEQIESFVAEVDARHGRLTASSLGRRAALRHRRDHAGRGVGRGA